MKIKYWTLLGLCLSLLSCSSSESARDENNSISLSQSSGLQCLEEGNVNCAKENFCAQSVADASNANAALRCCASLSLDIAFSENTQSLGRMLGYQPVPYANLKAGTLSEALAGKKIVFGELFFQSEAQSPGLRDLAIQWGGKLTSDHASTRELNQKIMKLGNDLESLSQCLARIPENFSEDNLESVFFSSPETVKVTMRDLDFLKFATASMAYFLQTSTQYEWGFESFPAWPFPNSFYADINGKAGTGDLRFGDLNSTAAMNVLAKANLLQQGLQSFEKFLQEPKIGLIDTWLRWRFSQGDLVTYTSVIRSAAASLESGQWMSVSGEDFILNFASLKTQASLPNANLAPASIDLVEQNAQADPEINSDYLKWMFVNQIFWPHSEN